MDAQGYFPKAAETDEQMASIPAAKRATEIGLLEQSATRPQMVIVAPSSNGQVSKNGDACCKLAMNTGGQSIIAWRPSGHGGTVASGTDGALAVIRALKAENAALAHYLLVKSHSPMRPEASRCAPQKNPLTRREHEVLELVANGKRTKEIAAVLGIAFKTAACHRGRILNKLGVHSTTELIEAAVKVALVNL